MYIFFHMLIILLGAAFGSFFYVVAHRLEAKETFVLGRSRCNNCKKVLQPWEIIPILSFFILCGKCSGCNDKISRSNLFIESIFGLFLAICIWKCQKLQDILLHFFNFSLLFLMAYTDKRYQEVRNIDIIILGVGNVLYAIIFWFVDHKLPTSGVILLFLLNGIVLLTKERYIGLGDTMILCSLSLTMTSIELFNYIYAVLIPAGIVSAIYLVRGVRKKKIPLVPYLWLGYALSLVFNMVELIL